MKDMIRISNFKNEYLIVLFISLSVLSFGSLILTINDNDFANVFVAILFGLILLIMGWFCYMVIKTYYFDASKGLIIIRNTFSNIDKKKLTINDIKDYKYYWISRRLDLVTLDGKRYISYLSFGKYKKVKPFLSDNN